MNNRFLIKAQLVSDNGSYFERRILQLEEFRLVNQKALEFFEPETLQSAICAPFYCIFSWVVCFNFSGGNFVKADYSRIIIRIPLTKDQTQKILSEVDGNKKYLISDIIVLSFVVRTDF